MSDSGRPPNKGYRDVLVAFVNSPDPKRYRVYESMYDRVKDVLYNSDSPKFRYIVAYEWYVDTAKDGTDFWAVADEKTHINVENICYYKVIGRDSNGRQP